VAINTNEQDESDLMTEINMIPLIDVMLVLLIVFIITIPVIKHATEVNLPQASTEAANPFQEAMRLTVTADGSYRWNDEALDDNALEQRLAAIGALATQPPVHLMADRDVRYERVMRALAAAQRAGVRTIGFVTEPER
jgi:biopolymer transport protein ExbD